VLLSPIHAYYHNIEHINGGRDDMFAAMSTVGGYTMGYFDGSGMHAQKALREARVGPALGGGLWLVWIGHIMLSPELGG